MARLRIYFLIRMTAYAQEYKFVLHTKTNLYSVYYIAILLNKLLITNTSNVYWLIFAICFPPCIVSFGIKYTIYWRNRCMYIVNVHFISKSKA